MTGPVRLPPSARVEALFSREWLPWALIGVPLGLVEGATVAVFVKKGYGPILPAGTVNLAVALVTGAPAMANIISFAWANLAHGRSRVSLLVGLLAAFAFCVGLIAFAPNAGGGLVLTIAAVIVARMLWAGVLTVRAAIWTANYPRHVIARVTGRIVVYNEVGMAAVAMATGWLLIGNRPWHAGSTCWRRLPGCWPPGCTARFVCSANTSCLRPRPGRVSGLRLSVLRCCARSCAPIRDSAATCSG